MRLKVRQIIMMGMIISFGIMTIGLTPVKASLWNFYQEIGQDLPSIKHRAELAAEYGIWGYKGTAEQNDLLEKYLKEEYYKDDQNLGFSVISRYKTTLSSSMTSSQTTVPVSSISTFDGTTITMALLGGTEVFLTLEPGSNKEEIVRCTAISGTSWTGCTRGLAFSGTSKSAVVANQKTHNAGSTVVMSNTHYVYENFIDALDAETIAGIKTFTHRPLIDAAGGVASSSQQIVTFGELQSMANQGAATSTESIAGISEQATQLEMASSTQFDVNNPHFISSEYATTTPYGHSNIGNFVVIGNNNGYINSEWINESGNYDWTGTNTHAGTETFNATTTVSFIRGTVSYQMTAAEAITRGDAVVIGENGIYRADGDLASTTVHFIGIAKDSVSAGQQVDVFTSGIVSGLSGLTTASTTRDMYISNTTGSYSSATGTVEMFIGKAISSTELVLQKPTWPQFLSSANDVSDVITVPQHAKMAIVFMNMTDGTDNLKCQVTLFRNGLGSQTCSAYENASIQQTGVANWDITNRRINLTFADATNAINGTAYFYY